MSKLRWKILLSSWQTFQPGSIKRMLILISLIRLKHGRFCEANTSTDLGMHALWIGFSTRIRQPEEVMLNGFFNGWSAQNDL